MKVETQFITASRILCGPCRMADVEDPQGEIELVEVTIRLRPENRLATVMFTLCPDHFRGFIREVNRAGIAALGIMRAKADMALESQFTEGEPDGEA